MHRLNNIMESKDSDHTLTYPHPSTHIPGRLLQFTVARVTTLTRYLTVDIITRQVFETRRELTLSCSYLGSPLRKTLELFSCVVDLNKREKGVWEREKMERKDGEKGWGKGEQRKDGERKDVDKKNGEKGWGGEKGLRKEGRGEKGWGGREKYCGALAS